MIWINWFKKKNYAFTQPKPQQNQTENYNISL